MNKILEKIKNSKKTKLILILSLIFIVIAELFLFIILDSKKNKDNGQIEQSSAQLDISDGIVEGTINNFEAKSVTPLVNDDISVSLAFTKEAPKLTTKLMSYSAGDDGQDTPTPMFGSGALLTATACVTKTIQATILPTTAENQKVSWSVEWGGSQTGNVTDYITVVPQTAGSTTASVNCYKPFTGEIVIVCTTDEGGYIATCTVTFKGIPSDFVISGGSIALVNNELDLGIGSTYTYSVSLANIFNQVGTDFNQISATVQGVGTIKVGSMEHYNQSGNNKWWDSSLTDISLDSIKDALISTTLSNGTLTITTKKAIESYYQSSQRMDGGRTIGYTNKFYSYVTDCYFNITLKENVSGLTKVIKVVFDEGVVTSVTLNNSELVF